MMKYNGIGSSSVDIWCANTADAVLIGVRIYCLGKEHFSNFKRNELTGLMNEIL